jgi:hypothetical protein
MSAIRTNTKEKRNAYKVLVRKLETKSPLWIYTRI